MPARTTPWQKTKDFFAGLKGKLPDKELAVIKRYMENRSRKAEQVTVTPVDTVLYCSPRPLNPEILSDVHVKMEEKDEGKMDPELKELEPPSVGADLEMPGQQCPPNEGTWEKGRTIADGYLFVGTESNQGGDISSPKTERADTRAVRTTANITFLQQGHRPKDDETYSEENKQFDPGGEEGEQPPPCKAAVMVVFSFPQGSFGLGVPAVCALCSFPVFSAHYLLFFSGDHFSAS